MIAAFALAGLLATGGATAAPVRAFAAAPMYLPTSGERTVDYVHVVIPLKLTFAGHDLRITLSNAHGHEAATIASAVLRVAGHDYPLTFGGATAVTLPVGAPMTSDAVPAHVAAEQIIDLDLRLDQPTVLAAVHRDPLNPARIVDGHGLENETVMRPFLAAVDVTPDEGRRGTPAATIVALGDSISDWDCRYATPEPCMWEAELARRLARAGKPYAIANAAISADRILTDGPGGNAPWDGLSALARFDRDVLAVPGGRYVVMLMGTNDIGMSGQNGAPVVSAEAVIGGMKQLILRAHAHGLKIYGAPILPFRGHTSYSAEKEAVRQAVNAWMRDGHAFDGLIDFAGAVADPADPGKLAAAFDNGDHLHPNGAGQKAMGDAIDLRLFK